MFGGEWGPDKFPAAQKGVRVDALNITVDAATKGRISCHAEVDFKSERGGTLALLNPHLGIRETRLDGRHHPVLRTGVLLSLEDAPGRHRLGLTYEGSIPSDGGLGMSGTSFDLNMNVLWYPIMVWGSRVDARLNLQLSTNTEAILPPVARLAGGSISIPSAVDVPFVGGRIQGSYPDDNPAVYSLIRSDVTPLHRLVKQVVEWLEGRWGPLPFRPLRLAETWRKKQGAYAREGLVTTPDWSRTSEAEVAQRLVHEVAHQWWGMDALPGEAWFAEDWLSEGMAVYSEFLWLKEKRGRDEAARLLATATKEVDGLQGALSAMNPFSQEGWSLSRYGGLLALVALERRIPDLPARLRTFRDRHKGTFVTTRWLVDDLRDTVPESWLHEHLLTSRTWPGDVGELVP